MQDLSSHNKLMLFIGVMIFIALMVPESGYTAPQGYAGSARASNNKGLSGGHRGLSRGQARSSNTRHQSRSRHTREHRQRKAGRAETSARTESSPRSANTTRSRSYNVSNNTQRPASSNRNPGNHAASHETLSRPVSSNVKRAPRKANRTPSQARRNNSDNQRKSTRIIQARKNTITSKRQQLANKYSLRSTPGRSKSEAVKRLSSEPVNFHKTNFSSKNNKVANTAPAKSENISSGSTTTVANKTISIRGNTNNVGIRGNTATPGLRDNTAAFDARNISIAKVTTSKTKKNNNAKKTKSGHGKHKNHHGHKKHHKHHKHHKHYYSPFVFFSFYSSFYPYSYYPTYYNPYPYSYSYYPFPGPVGYDSYSYYENEPVYSTYVPYGLNSSGWTYLAERNYQAAMIVFNDEIQTLPDAGLPKVGYALVSAATGNMRDAVIAMREAFEVEPESISYMSNTDEILSLINELIDKYEYMIQPGYHHPDEAFMLSALHYLKHDYGSAHEAINLAILGGDKSPSLGQLHKQVDNKLSSNLAADYY